MNDPIIPGLTVHVEGVYMSQYCFNVVLPGPQSQGE